MKLKLRTGILAVLGIMLIFSVPLVANTEGLPVEFQNQDIELQVKQQVGKATGDVYSSELEELTTLRLQNKEFEDLSWLKYCDNLERLYISGNIKDTSFLSSFIPPQWGVLKALSLTYSNISDLSTFENLYWLINMSWLEAVDLAHNNITNIQPLVENTDPEGADYPDGLGEGDILNVSHNNLDLSEGSEDLQDIQTLIDRGVEVKYYPQKEEGSL